MFAKTQKKFQVKKVRSRGFYGLLEKGILCLLTLRQNKNNNFMFPNEKVMADQKTLIFPSKNFAFFTLTDAQKTLIIWP